jgi:hypothetical protein
MPVKPTDKKIASPFKDAIVPTAGGEMRPTAGTKPAANSGKSMASGEGKIKPKDLPSNLSDILHKG